MNKLFHPHFNFLYPFRYLKCDKFVNIYFYYIPILPQNYQKIKSCIFFAIGVLSIYGGNIMEFGLISFNSNLIKKQAANEVTKCNNYTEKFGLALSHTQAMNLVETRYISLQNNGRIEFGGGVIDKIIKEFCDSPYVYQSNYEQTLHDLIEIFYYYKNETMDLITDEELIKFMRTSFDGVCQGSLELLSERELYGMAKNLRFGYPIDSYNSNISHRDEDDDE